MLSRPWRHIHLHTPIIDLNLDEFLYFAEDIVDDRTSLPGLLEDDTLLGVHHTLLRREKEGSNIDLLMLECNAGDPHVRRRRREPTGADEAGQEADGGCEAEEGVEKKG